MLKKKLRSGKSLVLRNLVELPVEIKLDKYIFKLSILYILLYAFINSRKITVLIISFMDAAVKF